MKRRSVRSTKVNPEAEIEFRKFQSATRRRKDEHKAMTVLGVTADSLDALWKSKWAVKFKKRSDLYLAVLLHVNDKRACATCEKPADGVLRQMQDGKDIGPGFLCPEGHYEPATLKPLD
jgi:hypothetical protein